MRDCHCDPEPYKPAFSGRNSSSGAAPAGGSGVAADGAWVVGSVRSEFVSLIGAGSTVVVDGQTFVASKEAEEEGQGR